MSNKRPPLLSDENMVDPSEAKEGIAWPSGCKMSPYAIRDHYEEARAKDAELIQRLVDALYGLWFEIGGIIVAYRKADKALDAAEKQGFKPK